MDPLALLNSAQKSDEVKRTISTAAILWAFSSVVVFALSGFGLISSYENAIPFVVLVAWMGAEVVARLPGRTPIAVCEQCGRVQVLPKTPLRKYWPWKSCTICGGKLNYSCPNKHLLSLFINEEIPPASKGIWCSRCGLAARTLSEEEFIMYLEFLISQKPKEMDHLKLAPLIWRMVDGTELGGKLKEPMSEIARIYKQSEYESGLGPLVGGRGKLNKRSNDLFS